MTSNAKSTTSGRRVEEDARAPERRADARSPTRRAEAGLELPDLEDPDRRVHAVRHDREADVAAGGALAMRPGDEPLEPFDRRRRRRDEPRHLLGRQHRQQRRRVREPQLAQRRSSSGQSTGSACRQSLVVTVVRRRHHSVHVNHLLRVAEWHLLH